MQHIYLYSATDDVRKPGPLRLCLRPACIGEPRDAKVRVALMIELTRHQPGQRLFAVGCHYNCVANAP